MNIKFSLPDGTDVEIIRDAFTGSFKCLLDGKEFQIKSPFHIGTHFAIGTTHNCTVEVGDKTTHLIEIEHSRPRFFGGLRLQRYVVAGNIVADRTGY